MNFNSTKKNLRQFGLLVGGVFLLIALYPIIKGQAPRWFLMPLGVGLIFFGFFLPASLEHPYKIWMAVGHFLGAVNSRVLMFVLFVSMVTPVSLVLRIFGRKKFLDISTDKQKDSYAVPSTPRKSNHFEYQF